MENTLEETLKIIQENVVSKMKYLGLPTHTCKVTDIRCVIASIVKNCNGATYYDIYRKECPGLNKYLDPVRENFTEEITCLQELIVDSCENPDLLESAKGDIESGNADESLTPGAYICEMILARFICENTDYNWCTSCEDFAVEGDCGTK